MSDEIDIDLVLATLVGRRFPLEDEKQTQAAIHAALLADLDGFVFREHRIEGGIIDFVVVCHPGPGFVGIEVKLKGQPASIVRQITGYATDPQICGLVLVTAKAMPMPPMICGKPVHVFDLGRAWL